MIKMSRRTRSAINAGARAGLLRLNAIDANPYKPRSKCWTCWLWAHFEALIAMGDMDGGNPVKPPWAMRSM